MTVRARLIRAVVILSTIALVGCSRQDGKASFEFLKAQHKILIKMELELKKYSIAKPPSAPVFSQQPTRRQWLEATKEYRDALDSYFTAMAQNCQQMERLLKDAQTRISGLNPAGIDPEAVILTELRERLLGDKVQMCVEVKALAVLEQGELRRNTKQEFITPLLIGIFALVASEDPVVGVHEFFRGVSKNMKQDMERQREAQAHLQHIQEIVASLEQDKSQTVTKRSELITSFGAKYPGYPWNSLLSATAQSSKNNPEQSGQ